MLEGGEQPAHNLYQICMQREDVQNYLDTCRPSDMTVEFMNSQYVPFCLWQPRFEAQQEELEEDYATFDALEQLRLIKQQSFGSQYCYEFNKKADFDTIVF